MPAISPVRLIITPLIAMLVMTAITMWILRAGVSGLARIKVQRITLVDDHGTPRS